MVQHPDSYELSHDKVFQPADAAGGHGRHSFFDGCESMRHEMDEIVDVSQ
jgi:hypothetical protein